MSEERKEDELAEARRERRVKVVGVDIFVVFVHETGWFERRAILMMRQRIS